MQRVKWLVMVRYEKRLKYDFSMDLIAHLHATVNASHANW